MDSRPDPPRGGGFPIRISTDQRLLAAPRGFSQRATSFVASQCQGIHQMPFLCLITKALRLREAPTRAQGRTPPHAPHPAAMHFSSEGRRPRRPVSQPAAQGAPRLSFLFTCPRSAPAAPAPSGGRGRRTGGFREGARLSPRGPFARKVVCAASRGPRQRDKTRQGPGTGGGGRDRTDDLMLAKHALSQLSYAPGGAARTVGGAPRPAAWWAREDLNLRPHAYQARALTN